MQNAHDLLVGTLSIGIPSNKNLHLHEIDTKLKRISEAIKSQEIKTAYWWEKNVCKL